MPDASYGDATVDGAVNTDGGFLPGDSLVVEPALIRTVASWVQCVRVSVRRMDGTTELLNPQEVTLSIAGPGAAQAILGEVGDCADPMDFPIIGTVAGPESALMLQAGPLSFPARLEVLDAQIRAEAFVPQIVGPRDATFVMDTFIFSLRAYDDAGDRIQWGLPVERQLQIRIEDPSLVELSRENQEQYLVRGLRIGSSRLFAEYPADSFESEQVDIRIVDEGTLSGVRLRVHQPGVPIPSGVSPQDQSSWWTIGDCFDVDLMGRYSVDGGGYEALIEEVSWQSAGLTRTGGQFCVMEAGDGFLTGCAGAHCATIYQVIPQEGLVGVRIEPATEPPLGGGFQLCPALSVHLDYADGHSEDVANARGLAVDATFPTSDVFGGTAQRFRNDETGDFYRDGDGHPCMTVDSFEMVSGVVPFGFVATVGGIQGEGTIDVTLP